MPPPDPEVPLPSQLLLGSVQTLRKESCMSWAPSLGTVTLWRVSVLRRPFQDLHWPGREDPGLQQEAGLEAGSEGWGGALVVVCPPRWPCAALLVCLLPASPSFFPGTCRCFRRQSQGAEEGRVSAHVVLQGGLRGPGPQVARPEGTCLPSMAPLSRQTKVLSSGSPGVGELRSLKHIGSSHSLEGTLPGVSLLLHTDPLEIPLGLFIPEHLRGG